jgi:antitoxin (DNA-binding transcriptional repressor) of toxin-antitoxin stability system
LLDWASGEVIVITKRGKPVARLVAFHAESKNLIGSLVGKIKIKATITSTGARWDAER